MLQTIKAKIIAAIILLLLKFQLFPQNSSELKWNLKYLEEALLNSLELTDIPSGKPLNIF